MPPIHKDATFAAIVAAITPHPPKPPHEQKSRSGRNMPVAVATSAVLLLIVAASIIFNPQWFIPLAVLAFAIGLWEITGALLKRDIHVPLMPMLLSLALMAVSTYLAGLIGGMLAFCFSALFCAMWRLYTPRAHALRDSLVGVFVLGWICFNGMFALAMPTLDHAQWCIAALIVLSAASDTGGLAFGVAFGRHPIASSVSPKKSWEGFAGSVLFAFIFSLLLIHYGLGLSWLWVCAFTVVTPVLGTLGDFYESLVKRDLDLKDMGSIFPGHGGMLDRIDAMLFCAPTFYFMYEIAYGLLT